MLVPYSTERQLQRIPLATIILIGLNLIFAVLTWSDFELFTTLMFNPARAGWWQPVTHTFIHVGPLHLIGNMIFLWVFGSHVEDTIGVWKFLLLYFSAGLAAIVLQMGSELLFLGGLHAGAGASGCIMGLVALFAIRFRRVKINLFYWWWLYMGTWQIAAIWMALAYFVMDLGLGIGLGAAGLASGVANFAHVGGFIAGLVWSYALHLPAAAHRDEASEEFTRLAASGVYEMAGAAAEQELVARPNDPDLHWRAASYFEMKPRTRSRAISHWNKALHLWLRQGRENDAFRCWDRLMHDHRPEVFDPEIMCDLAVARENAGQLQQAADIYQAIACDHADSRPAAIAALRLANLLSRMGYTELARQWYHRVIQRWPDHLECLEATNELQCLNHS